MKTKIIFILAVILLTIGLLRYCDRPVVSPTNPGKLAPGEKERIEVRGKTVTVIRADRTIRTFAPAGAKVRVGDDGTVHVDVRKFGFVREPGLGVAWNDDKLKLVLDFKVAYYRRAGFHLGSAYDPTSKKLAHIVKPLVMFSYTMPFDGFANTSVWVGSELFPQRMSGGLRLSF